MLRSCVGDNIELKGKLVKGHIISIFLKQSIIYGNKYSQVTKLTQATYSEIT